MSGSLPPYGHPSGDAVTLMRYDAGKKTALLGYLLWFFLGSFGAHRFYFGRTGSAVAMLLIFILSIPLAFIAVGLLGFMVVGIWWIVDAFLIPGMVAENNARLIEQLRR